MPAEALAEVLRSIVTHQNDVMMTFAVATEGGTEAYQTPIIKPISVRETKDGHSVVTGYNLRRLPDEIDEAKEVECSSLIRSYRIDRIVAHTLQFLNPSTAPTVPPEEALSD